MNPKLKRDVLGKCWIFLYVNLWYVPLLVFLLGIKISLISMLADSLQRGGGLESPAAAYHPQEERNPIIEIVTSRKNQDNNKVTNHIPSGSKEEQPDGGKSRWRRKSKSVNLSGGGEGWEYKLRLSHQPLTAEDWKVLADIENVRIVPTHLNRTDKDSIWVILNQVPWGGGDLIDNLLQELQDQNNFKHLQHEYRTPWPRFLLEEEQKSLVTWFEYQHLPRSYDRHFYFVNFTKYQQYVFENPIYVNMVQNPVSRLHLAFDWKRSEREKAQQEVNRREEEEGGAGHKLLEKDFQDCVLKADPECSFEDGSSDFTLMVPFFCGQFNSCVIINNKWALQTAKFNIEKYYSVVGVFEKLTHTLFLLEHYVPRFFAGATNYESEKLRPDLAPISPEAEEILRRKLSSEFDLYQFIVQRLEKQVQWLVESKRALVTEGDLK